MSRRPSKPVDSYPVAELPPLPPPGAEGEKAPAAAPSAPRKKAEVAALQFLDPDALGVDYTFKHPFLLNGEEVRVRRIRRLTLAEVGALKEQILPDDEIDLIPFFAAMIDLPAPVFRGLPSDDGEAIMEKAIPFLPRIARAALDLLTLLNGGDTA